MNTYEVTRIVCGLEKKEQIRAQFISIDEKNRELLFTDKGYAIVAVFRGGAWLSVKKIEPVKPKNRIQTMYEECLVFDEDLTRHEFLSSDIFGFVTYDSDADKVFSRVAVTLAEAINNNRGIGGHTDMNLLMVNMPFFADRIEWGTSIRSAFWASRVKDLEGNEITAEEWREIVSEIIEFARA